MYCNPHHQVSQLYFLEAERPANRQRSGKQENRRPPGSGEFRGGGDFRGERDERPPRGGRGGRPRLSSREKDRVGWCLWFVMVHVTLLGIVCQFGMLCGEPITPRLIKTLSNLQLF